MASLANKGNYNSRMDHIALYINRNYTYLSYIGSHILNNIDNKMQQKSLQFIDGIDN